MFVRYGAARHIMIIAKTDTVELIKHERGYVPSLQPIRI